jgi:mono/diheme cytochrome c family protein
MRVWRWIGVVVVVAAGYLCWWALSMSVPHHEDVPASAELVSRGAYLVRAGDCVVCHTKPGGPEFAGGREFDLGVMGRLYSPNITPDRETGIGAWKDDDFRAALQLGVGRGGKHLYPVFPYASFSLLSDADAVAIKAYLFSLPPVRTHQPANDMKFPFNLRILMAFWSALFNPNQRFVADSRQSDAWNRGRYLVEGLGHCGECHTPRNLMQARKSRSAYAGAVAQKWQAYNISSDSKTGLGNWSDDALISYLSSGHADGHGTASGPMAEIVQHSLQWLDPDDIKAMVTYLRTIPPQAATDVGGPGERRAADEALLAYGKSVYVGICADCHRTDGTGVNTPYQTLRGATTLSAGHAVNLVQVILEGSRLATAAGEANMPSFARGYSDAEIAAVANYAARQLGTHDVGISASDVKHQR